MSEIKSVLPPKISLRAARVNANLLQREVADMLGINKATLQSYESGATVPNWDIVEKMEQLYDYPASYIFFGHKTRLKRVKRKEAG